MSGQAGASLALRIRAAGAEFAVPSPQSKSVLVCYAQKPTQYVVQRSDTRSAALEGRSGVREGLGSNAIDFSGPAIAHPVIPSSLMFDLSEFHDPWV
jgi:hypothetical protein